MIALYRLSDVASGSARIRPTLVPSMLLVLIIDLSSLVAAAQTPLSLSQAVSMALERNSLIRQRWRKRISRLRPPARRARRCCRR